MIISTLRTDEARREGAVAKIFLSAVGFTSS
jgi:hypothetical protein